MTPSCEAEKEDQGYFNSPLHKKNHIATTMINTVFFKISTHILTKRMTKQSWKKVAGMSISTHILTKRMTGDVIRLKNSVTFQLTSSRRGWPNEWLTRVGIDIFQLTSSRRGWRKETEMRLKPVVFQLTSSRRGWQRSCPRYASYLYFNSHPHEEDDIAINATTAAITNFNSHPHEEDDWKSCGRWTYTVISTHILTKRMTRFG